MTELKEIEKLLVNAKGEIKILGVVNLAKLDWNRITDAWEKHIKNNQNFSITILCESDNFLFAKSFTTDNEYMDNRIDFKELQFLRDRISDDLAEEIKSKGLINNIIIEIIYIPIPLSFIKIDEKIFINLWLENFSYNFMEISEDHIWKNEINKYLKSFFDSEIGRKYAASQYDEKREPIETLELYDHNRIPRGIYPRSSFYDTDYSQLVVWALIFDRKGRLLIHRRADNAKDNRSMWDKSVGGHVDFSLDVDTSRAILREVIEELFTEEKAKEYKFFDVTDEEMIFLGEWRPSRRKKYPFNEINKLKREWVYFRLKDSQQLYSPRTTKDNKTKRLRVISDVYLFIANESLTEESIKELKNSEFKLIELAELKSIIDKSLKKELIPNFDPTLEIPKFSPDLINIFTGELRNILQEFSQYLKYYIE